MEYENRTNVSKEALAAERQIKRRTRIFGLFVGIDFCLLALFVYELIAIVTH